MSSLPNRTKSTPFQDTAHSHTSPSTIGGILSSCLTAWTAFGSHLRVLDISSGRRISSWHFGHTIRDSTTQILCITELSNPRASSGRIPLLAVGLSSGLICIFEPVTSRVLKAIHVGAAVTSLAIVGINWGLSGPGRLMEAFDGVISVGLAGGDVLLVDLCRHSISEALNIYSSSVIRDEERPCEVFVIYRSDLGRLNRLKERAANTGKHLAYHLNYHPAMDLIDHQHHFLLQSTAATSDKLLVFPRSPLSVTALLYAAPLCSLLVAYSFGRWQLFSLLEDSGGGDIDEDNYGNFHHVLYTSGSQDVPVRFFALQEPSDDPRACSYVWAVHSATGGQGEEPYGIIYEVRYERKEWHDGYGWIYERLTSVSIRFRMKLTSDFPTTMSSDTNITLQCLSVRSYSLGSTNRAQHSTNPPPSSLTDDPLELCTLAYTTTNLAGHCRTYMVVFDLNQWYLSQIPSEPRGTQWQTYMVRECVGDGGSGRVLDVRLDESTVRGFRMRLRRLEEHFRPDALSYSCSTLTPVNCASFHHLGTQSRLLHNLNSLGPLALLKPSTLYMEALACGLTNTNIPSTTTATLQQQRESLLDVALEQRLQSVLERCASDWADGSSLAVGCGLHGWLLEWAWAKAGTVKDALDELCVALFDGSRIMLDTRGKVQLDCYGGQLERLRRLFEHVRSLGTGGGEGWMVEKRADTLGAVCRWLGVLRWLLGNGLLPEGAGKPDTGGATAALDRIKGILDNRRNELSKIQLTLNKLSNKLPKPQLFIDALIEEELGGYSALSNLWVSNTTTTQILQHNINKYPPISLQAALRTYLIQAQQRQNPLIRQNKQMLIQYQHTFFGYLMLDIAAADHQFQEEQHGQVDRSDQLSQQLIGFPLVFSLGLQQSKLIQAMWQLDRGEFALAMEHLVDPSVTAHAPKWLHSSVVVRLLHQGQHRFALLYVQLRRPSKLTEEYRAMGHGSVEDWLMCTLFVRNGRLYDALKCAREISNRKQKRKIFAGSMEDEDDMDCKIDENDELLGHIWSECARSGQLNNTLITSIHGLTAHEEKSLFAYMDQVDYPNRNVMRAIYTAQRASTHTRHKLGGADQHRATTSLQSTFYEKMLDNIMCKNDLMYRGRDSMNSTIDGSVPMSVLIHYNEFTVKKKKKSDNVVVDAASMLLKMRDTCAATIGATLRQQQQLDVVDQRHLRGQKRKQQSQSSKNAVTVEFYADPHVVMQPDDHEHFSSPRKRMRNADTSFKQSTNRNDIDTSYQMATPLIKRQQRHLSSPQNNVEHTTPSMVMDSRYYQKRDTETPQSILKKRIDDRSSVNTMSSDGENNKGQSTTPEVLDNIYVDAQMLKGDRTSLNSPKRRRSIGRSTDCGATVRFDISLSTTTTSDTTATDNSAALQQQQSLATIDSSSRQKLSDAATTATSTLSSSATVTSFYSAENSDINELHVSQVNNNGMQLGIVKTVVGEQQRNDLSILHDNEVMQVVDLVQGGKSPMKRKSIRDISEERIVGIRSSPRLQQRRSADREMLKTEIFVPSSPQQPSTTLSARRSLTSFNNSNVQQEKPNMSTITTVESELTPLKTIDEQHVIIAKTKPNEKSSFVADCSPQERIERFEEHHVVKLRETTSKSTSLSVEGFEEIQEDFIVCEKIEEIAKKETLEIITDISMTTTELDQDIEKEYNLSKKIITDMATMEPGKEDNLSKKSTSIDLENNGEYKQIDYLTNVDVDSEVTGEMPNKNDTSEYKDILEDNYGEEINIYEDLDEPTEAEQTIDQLLEDERMEVDEDHNSVIEISSSNGGSTESNESSEVDSEESNRSLNKAVLIEETSTGSISQKTSISCYTYSSGNCDSASIKSADIGHLEEDIDIDASQHSDIYDKDTDIEDCHNDEDKETSITLAKDDINRKSVDSDVNIKTDSKTSNNDVTDSEPLHPEITSIDVLQMTFADDDKFEPIPVEKDILCISLDESTEIFKNTSSTTTPDSLKKSQTSSATLNIDPLIEKSFTEEDIQVDPDILTVTFHDDDDNDDNEPTKCAAIKKDDSVGPIRRSNRIRRDSGSSVASNLSATSNKSMSAIDDVKPKRKTRRSLSTDERAQVEVIVAKPARRSNRRTRSVDTPEQLEDCKRQTTQWLSTIVEEQQLETKEDSKKLSGDAMEVIQEVIHDLVVLDVGKRQRRSASVDSSPLMKPKRGRPRKTSTTVDFNSFANNSPMQTRARTNSTSSTRSDSVLITTPRRLTMQSDKIENMERNVVEGAASSRTPPKRVRRGSRTKQ